MIDGKLGCRYTHLLTSNLGKVTTPLLLWFDANWGKEKALMSVILSNNSFTIFTQDKKNQTLMQKFYSLLGSFLLIAFLTVSGNLKAQNVQIQSSSFIGLPATSCTNTSISVTALKLCINITYNGGTFSISGNTITVSLDYSLGPICLGALAVDVQTISLGTLPAGNYNVVVEAVLNTTSVSTLNTTLSVASCCSATSDFSPSLNAACIGDSVYFDNTSTGATSSQWYENNIAVSSSTNFGKTYTTPGVYSVKLVVQGAGCSDSTIRSITVANPPTLDLGPDVEICPGTQVVLDAGGGRDSLLWSDQSVFRSLVVTSPGKYYVDVYKSNCKVSDTVEVSFKNVQDVNLGNDTTICTGDTLMLDASLAGASYKWQNNSTQSSFKVSSSGTYYVTRTDTNGCKVRDTIVVTVDANCNTSLIENDGFVQVSVYPNPVKNILSIDLPVSASNNYTLEIFDLSGKLIKSQKVEVDNMGSIFVDVSDVSSGIYTLKLLNRNAKYTARWLKQ